MNHPAPQPIFTTLPAKGLAKPFTILQITDLHACAVSEEEAAAMPTARYEYILPRIGLFSGGRPYPSEASLPVLIDYADEIKADLILMTGDIIDFPGETNFALLEREIARSRVPVLYILGNHDWSFADDYHTPSAAASYLPRMDALSGGDHHIACFETEQIVVCAVDDQLDRVSAETVDAYFSVAERARASGKALVLAMHIPLQVDSLVEDTVRVWRRNLCIGRGAMGGNHPDTLRFFDAVTESTDHAPDVVITGHLHFSHEDVFPNGVPQLVTDIASGGLCRVITLCPEGTCDAHTEA